VQNGEALILGGLIKDQYQSGSSELPFLSNIPIIGWLFGLESKFNRRTKLVLGSQCGL
jgi:general secretion pathway protein D